MIRLIALSVDGQINAEQPGWKKEPAEKPPPQKKGAESAKWRKVGEED